MDNNDTTLQNLLELDGTRFVLDELLGIWVKFDIKKIQISENRPHGIKYSLTLHDRSNKRIIGFDNAHAIEYGRKNQVAPMRIYDHWHREEADKGIPYSYINAGKLMEDFWTQVDKVLNTLREV